MVELQLSVVEVEREQRSGGAEEESLFSRGRQTSWCEPHNSHRHCPHHHHHQHHKAIEWCANVKLSKIKLLEYFKDLTWAWWCSVGEGWGPFTGSPQKDDNAPFQQHFSNITHCELKIIRLGFFAANIFFACTTSDIIPSLSRREKRREMAERQRTPSDFYRTQVSLVRSMDPSVCHWERLLKLNWCDSGWWRYQLNTCW